MTESTDRKRLVVALGGNALLRRGQALTVANQRQNVRRAARALAPMAQKHELVISHGNGPQVGLLALQAAAYTESEPFPLDVLSAQTEGMIGYMIEQELGNLMPAEQPFATLLTMVEVDGDDPAWENPTKPIGPVYSESKANLLAQEHGWTVARDGDYWRRVVPSPIPKRIFEILPIKWLLERGTIVICTGGGGVPTMYRSDEKRILRGAEAVIDKDRASALLALELDADFLILATDTDAVYLDWGTPLARPISRISPAKLRKHDFATGSMGPKTEAACYFVEKSGGKAIIGALEDLDRITEGVAGTWVEK